MPALPSAQLHFTQYAPASGWRALIAKSCVRHVCAANIIQRARTHTHTHTYLTAADRELADQGLLAAAHLAAQEAEAPAAGVPSCLAALHSLPLAQAVLPAEEGDQDSTKCGGREE